MYIPKSGEIDSDVLLFKNNYLTFAAKKEV